MFAKLKTSIALSVGALTLAAALVSTPAAADFLRPVYWPLYHYHHHFWPGPSFSLGLVAPDIIGSCIRHQAVFDSDGNYAGRRVVNLCY